MPNFQNNFATNLTSNTGSGATTSPINSIPTVDAPYYIAFDATNLNGHYEVVHVTSDTATNVNHAATTYDHTTAEEVRLVLPAVHLNTMQNFPRGFLINGKISVTYSAPNLTVKVLTLNGTDPSVTDPVYIRIGNTVRNITSTLSVNCPNAYNWFNSGSAELATKEIDYFVYLFWNSTNSTVKVGFGRINHANLYGDFDHAGSAGYEKSVWMDTTNMSSTDECEVIGRFAATLSAGAGYTWSVPTFTAANLIQRPIYETRWLTWAPTLSGGGTNPTYTGIYNNHYKISGDKVHVHQTWYNAAAGTAGSGANIIYFTMPFGCGSTIFSAVETRVIASQGSLYESAGTICPVIAVFNQGDATQVLLLNTNTLAVIVCNDQSSTARSVLLTGDYQI